MPKVPSVSWFQRRGQLTLVFSCNGAQGAPTSVVAAEELKLTWDTYELSARFLKPVAEKTASWRKVGHADKLELVVRKAASGPHWPAVFEGGKRSNVKPDWDRWVEEDDDPEGPGPLDAKWQQWMEGLGGDDTAFPAASDGAQEKAPDAPSQTAAPLEGLDLGSLDDDGRLQQWRSLTMPQRMLTMALMWNAMPADNRLASVRRLIELLRAVGGALGDLEGIIKGGLGVLRKLDTSVYDKERHATAWVSAFGAKATEQQVELMAELFLHLPEDEQRMVVGSLV